jgi:hypothetical protein
MSQAGEKMATFTGTAASETITPTIVSGNWMHEWINLAEFGHGTHHRNSG